MYTEEMYQVYFDFKLENCPEFWQLIYLDMLSNHLENIANVKFSHINWSVESMESTLLVVMYL